MAKLGNDGTKTGVFTHRRTSAKSSILIPVVPTTGRTPWSKAVDISSPPQVP